MIKLKIRVLHNIILIRFKFKIVNIKLVGKFNLPTDFLPFIRIFSILVLYFIDSLRKNLYNNCVCKRFKEAFLWHEKEVVCLSKPKQSL